MFDFEKLEVYQVTKTQNIEVMRFIFQQTELNADFSKNWKESSMGTVLNLAESTARRVIGIFHQAGLQHDAKGDEQALPAQIYTEPTCIAAFCE